MFFILSKVLDFLLSPFLWVFIVFLYAFFGKRPARKKKALFAGLFLLFFFSNSFIANKAFHAWEGDPVSLSTLKDYNTAIVLTGVAEYRKGHADRVFFGKGADRVIHTVQLYKLGKVKKILISGGSGALSGEKIAEADQLKLVFRFCGVPDSDIILENQSRNTKESSRYTKSLIDSLRINGEFLVVTSAFHMPRSVGCFEKAGLKVDAYPVDFYSNDSEIDLEELIIPSVDAISKWTLLIHEIFGFWVYKVMGYS